MNANIVDHIGSKVTVWTKDGNAAENRQLHTVDEFGIVISNQDKKRTFIPWCQIKYIDYADENAVKRQPVGEILLTSNGSLSSFSSEELFQELRGREYKPSDRIELDGNMGLEVRIVSKDGLLRGNMDIIPGPATIFIKEF
ncbi:hypothetical protein [Paenibacillus shenyangensis]|uniref:hypothetical protein n=1 Tax=Paenibacillus sp. A9 TaxID=1284352 RepID=UPI0003738FB3|nr:hypothetical protein [Paenibacillus sp. A9]